MADIFHAVRQAGKAGDGGDDLARVAEERLDGAISQRRILPIVRAGKALCIGHLHHLVGAARQRIVQRAIDDKDSTAQHLADRHRIGGGAVARFGGGGKLGEDGRGMIVIDADHQLAIGGGLRQHPRLDGGIIFHRAMAVDMIDRQVGQQRHVGLQARGQVDLEAGHFQHVNRLRTGRRQFQHRIADIAADLGVEAAGLQNMSHQRGGGGLAVGAGDRDHRRLAGCVAIGPDFAGEKFDIADHRYLRLVGMHHHAMRHGMGQRYARRQHQRGNAFPRPFAPWHYFGAFLAAQIARGGIVVPGDDARAAGHQRTHRAQARAGQAENGDGSIGKGAAGDHRVTAA